MSGALVLMSGGIDSTACAYFVKAQGIQVHGVFVDYGQRAAHAELAALTAVASQLQIPFVTVKISIPVEFGTGEILGRNALLVMAALPIALGHCNIVAMGIHDGTPYYDCSLTFARRINTLIQEYSNGNLQFIAPFLTWSKEQIFEYCQVNSLNVSSTYSCEAGETPCGECLSCLDRQLLNV